MTKETILVFFSMIAVLVGCGEGRMPDTVLWMQEGRGDIGATKTGELFVYSSRTGLKKISGQSGELIWEADHFSQRNKQLKATESGDLVVLEGAIDPIITLFAGDNGEQLWTQSIDAQHLDSAGDFIVLGGSDRTYLLNLDGSFRWEAPIAEGHTDAQATALFDNVGVVVRWEKLGQHDVLQAYDGADGSPTWSVETSESQSSNSVSLAKVGDLVVASLMYEGQLQIGGYILSQSSLDGRFTRGVFAINNTGMVLWARAVPINGDKMAPGLDGEVLLAGVSSTSQDVDGYEVGKYSGVLMALDMSSGKTNSVLSFFTSISSLTSDQVGRYYIAMHTTYVRYLFGLKQ